MNPVESILEILALVALRDPQNRQDQIFCGQKLMPLVPEILRFMQEQKDHTQANLYELQNLRLDLANLSGIIERLTKENAEMREIVNYGSLIETRNAIDRAIRILESAK